MALDSDARTSPATAVPRIVAPTGPPSRHSCDSRSVPPGAGRSCRRKHTVFAGPGRDSLLKPASASGQPGSTTPRKHGDGRPIRPCFLTGETFSGALGTRRVPLEMDRLKFFLNKQAFPSVYGRVANNRTMNQAPFVSTGCALSRRKFLKGAGILLSLPMLDAMTPAFAAVA